MLLRAALLDDEHEAIGRALDRHAGNGLHVNVLTTDDLRSPMSEVLSPSNAPARGVLARFRAAPWMAVMVLPLLVWARYALSVVGRTDAPLLPPCAGVLQLPPPSDRHYDPHP